MLRSGDLNKGVKEAANYEPMFMTIEKRSHVRELLIKKPFLRGVPIVDSNGDIVSIEFASSFIVNRKTRLGVPVVIMAGGKGTRLAPYTDVLPKPLIPIGDKTITEHIIDRFNNFGCDNFTMIINHKKGLIKAYYTETPVKGKLDFVEESLFQGTGGGLKLLTGTINDTFFMTNCDVLIEADYEDILRHHKKNNAIITMVCALKRITVPYGTVELNDTGRPLKLTEKPEYPLLTNTGLYVIEPQFLSHIPDNEFIHITDIIQQQKV
jgi:NDP-sugar pyrophosphorylase family protein